MKFTNKAGQDLFILDRSRTETAMRCARLYFWEYCFMGLGIRRARALPAWELETGTYIHEGIEALLRGTMGPADAALHAQAAYRDAVQPLMDELDLGETRELRQREFEQQLDLVLALVYGWGLVGLPRYLASYEMVDIEKEEEISFLVNGVEMRLLTRADIIGRNRQTGVKLIHNLKSVSNPDEAWRRQWAIDQCTLTERIATEERLGESISGVVIEGMCKGRKEEYPRASGFWQHNSPLIWAWADKQDGQSLPGEGQAFYPRFEWRCNAPHKFSNGRKCPGDKGHKLSGVYKARVADSYPGGIIKWIDWLYQNDLQVLEQQFISLPAIGRDAYEIEKWKRQVLPAEMTRQQNAEAVNEAFVGGNKQLANELLDYHFPQHTGYNCLKSPRECSYFDICFGGSDPLGEGWEMRVPNHVPEAELVQIELAKQTGVTG